MTERVGKLDELWCLSLLKRLMILVSLGFLTNEGMTKDKSVQQRQKGSAGVLMKGFQAKWSAEIMNVYITHSKIYVLRKSGF